MIKYPIGITDFKVLREEGYWFADKSLFIQEVLDHRGIHLIARPRRFGKTMNLVMLATFLASTPEERPSWFEGLAVAQTPLMNRPSMPVIFFSLKDLKEADEPAFQTKLKLTLSELYNRHHFLADTLSPTDRTYFDSVLNQSMDLVRLKSALGKLVTWLAQHRGQKVSLLIDEYDSPIHEAWVAGYFEGAVAFMRGFLGEALKDHPHLDHAVLTGILRLAKESIFSDLNNLRVNTMLSGRFADKFGFTEQEVDQLLQAANMSSKEDLVRQWYNGYKIGGRTLYNPWSLLFFMDEAGQNPKPYWANTSSNTLIHQLLIKSDLSVQEQLVALVSGESIESPIHENATLYDLPHNESLLWSFLFFSGYLTVAQMPDDPVIPVYGLKIPNLEVSAIYRQAFLLWQERELGSRDISRLQKALLTGDDATLSEKLSLLAEKVISFYDTAGKEPERFYHAFVLGLLANLAGKYEIRSNRESGSGRYDCILRPRKKTDPAVLIEFKTYQGEDPQAVLTAALDQITDRRYAAEFKDMGLTSWQEVAIAFNGKIARAQSRSTTAS